jgi:hypothetical protein
MLRHPLFVRWLGGQFGVNGSSLRDRYSSSDGCCACDGKGVG